MVAGLVLRLVAVLLLLVQDNHSQVFQRGEHRAAGTQNHPNLSPLDPLPLVVALAEAERAVEHGHLVAEVGGKALQHLGRQSNLRHQDHAGLSIGNDLLEQTDIDLRLSAAGDAEEQGAAGLLPPVELPQPLEGGPLLVVEGDRSGLCVSGVQGDPVGLLGLHDNEPRFLQRAQCGA